MVLIPVDRSNMYNMLHKVLMKKVIISICLIYTTKTSVFQDTPHTKSIEFPLKLAAIELAIE